MDHRIIILDTKNNVIIGLEKMTLINIENVETCIIPW